MGTRIGDGDLAHQLAVRPDDEEHGVAAKRTFGVEAEAGRIDIAVGPDRQSFDTRWHTRPHIGQNRQNVDLAAVKRTRGRRHHYAQSKGKSDSCSGQPTPSHLTPPEFSPRSSDFSLRRPRSG